MNSVTQPQSWCGLARVPLRQLAFWRRPPAPLFTDFRSVSNTHLLHRVLLIGYQKSGFVLEFIKKYVVGAIIKIC